MLHNQVHPLTLTEQHTFDRYLGKEIFTPQKMPRSHQLTGMAGFVTGGVSALVTYYLAVDLMSIFGANSQVGKAVGVIVIIPRMALNGNGLQDAIVRALHDYCQEAKLPRNQNHVMLRKLSDGFVYLSSAALGVMGVYILWNNLPYHAGLRSFLLPSILIGNAVVNIRPFLDVMDAIFAKYGSGDTPLIKSKRAALIAALNVSLNEIRGYNANQFTVFYRNMISSDRTTDSKWDLLLSLAENPIQPAPLQKTNWTKTRGYAGWFLSLLSSLTNIQISYAQAQWLAKSLDVKNDSFVPAIGIISSVLCVVAYGVLCAGPTAEVFENQKTKQGWEPSHPWLRKGSIFLAALFGFASAIPNASWPIVLGTNDYEKSLAGPAFISPGSLYMSALSILLNRLIDSYDRWSGSSQVIDHMDFLMKLQSLTRAIALLPPLEIYKLDHPVLRRYQGDMLSSVTPISSTISSGENDGSKFRQII